MQWEGGRSRSYQAENVSGVTETWLIGKAEKADNFAMRYYSVEQGGNTVEEQHEHDHGVMILHGQARVLLGAERHDLNHGDVIYIPPDVRHQIVNRGPSLLGFLCVIPAHRVKKGKDVWADEGIEFEETGTLE